MKRIELLLLSIALSLIGIGVLIVWGLIISNYSFRPEFLLPIGVVFLLLALFTALSSISRKNN